MYCGHHGNRHTLTRDHLLPVSRGGADCWNNVITACRSCNTRKGCQTPQEAGMPLLAIPYQPNKAEHLILANRRVRADQMAFLKNHLPRQRWDAKRLASFVMPA